MPRSPDVSWNDAKQFVTWLSETAAKTLSAAERGRVGIRRARRDADHLLVGAISFANGMVNCKNCLDTASTSR